MLKIHTDRQRDSAAGAGPAVIITRRVTFAAAHVLRRGDWDDERNRAVFGACAGEHGHNYVLEVAAGGAPDPETGMVVNLKDLDRLVRELVVDQVDHRHLNRDVAFLDGVLPTAENLALAFWRRLEAGFAERAPGCELRRLRLVESENNAAEVTR